MFRGRGEALDVTTATTGVAGRYASALFELADSAKSLDQVAQDLATFRKLLDESADLARLIASPVIGRALQGKALLAVLDAAGISGLTRSFIGTVAANGRSRDLPAMASAFLAELARRRGETTATVTSAVPLSPAQLQQLSTALRSVLASNKVSIDARVEPDILGGLVVKVGSRLFDSSVRSKLQRLQLAMKGVA
ncbi:F0F1 ATP synthase subunit delta [Reyranella humidisoli]|uniref:F0F1 ATP synthase subunit delta n=1 Tax=Reyranella humidisoli TaxID=2849149 RepID=UPI003F70A956